ncbi:MAG: hypothetical protein D6733_06735 [Methanobacteriota archaeon]|nr:MAG: hypothetical protein D6733_06735 [Euryarchaeota archaeon]
MERTVQIKRRCRDCTFYSLASEGLDADICRFFDRVLTREETMVRTGCPEFRPREEGKDADLYLPREAAKKAMYEREIRKYSLYMVLLLVLGILFFYLATAMA